jgi:RecB family exonuclease
VKRYGEKKMELLDRLGHASSLAEDGAREPLSRIGWETIPSSAPAFDPLPKRE